MRAKSKLTSAFVVLGFATLGVMGGRLAPLAAEPPERECQANSCPRPSESSKQIVQWTYDPCLQTALLDPNSGLSAEEGEKIVALIEDGVAQLREGLSGFGPLLCADGKSKKPAKRTFESYVCVVNQKVANDIQCFARQVPDQCTTQNVGKIFQCMATPNWQQSGDGHSFTSQIGAKLAQWLELLGISWTYNRNANRIEVLYYCQNLATGMPIYGTMDQVILEYKRFMKDRIIREERRSRP